MQLFATAQLGLIFGRDFLQGAGLDKPGGCARVTYDGKCLLVLFILSSNPLLAQVAFNQVTAGNESGMPGPIPLPAMPSGLKTERPTFVALPMKERFRHAWHLHDIRKIGMGMRRLLIAKIHNRNAWRTTHEDCCPWR